MKLSLISKSVLVICLLFISLGCEQKPTELNVVKDSKWELQAEGKLTEFKAIRDHRCTHDEDDPKTWCNEDYYILINDTKQFIAGRVINAKFISIGSIGKLYKYKGEIERSNDSSWFQWIMEEASKDITKDITTEIKEKDSKKIEKSIKIKREISPVEEIVNNWKRSDDIKELSTNDLVLIELSDDIITTGFITYDKKWKLGFNKNQYQYGKTLTNVLKWKRII